VTTLGAGLTREEVQAGYTLQIQSADLEATRHALDSVVAAAVNALGSAAASLQMCAAALASTANQLTETARVQGSRDTQVIAGLAEMTRALDGMCAAMVDMADVEAPTVTVEAPALPVLPAPTVTVETPPRTKTVTLTDSQGRTVTGTVTEK
jgi:hypothetical protein